LVLRRYPQLLPVGLLNSVDLFAPILDVVFLLSARDSEFLAKIAYAFDFLVEFVLFLGQKLVFVLQIVELDGELFVIFLKSLNQIRFFLSQFFRFLLLIGELILFSIRFFHLFLQAALVLLLFLLFLLDFSRQVLDVQDFRVVLNH